MSEFSIQYQGLNKNEKYDSLIPQLKSLVEGEVDMIANISNIVAALKETFSFFWIGVYFVKSRNNIEELVLGPFQGPPACVRITKGKGVCGTSWQRKESIIVPDVNLFPGHIACSPHSRSEIVVPLIRNNSVVGVLDIDSTVEDNFDTTDERYLKEIADIISRLI